MDDEDVMRMLEVVERRGEVYGISNVSTTPLRERNNAVSATTEPMADRQLTERKQRLSVTRTNAVQTTTLNMDSKENVDMAFEINVPSGTDVQVQVEVKDGDGNLLSRSPLKRLSMKPISPENGATSSAACIRVQRIDAIDFATEPSSSRRIEFTSAQNSDENTFKVPTHSAVMPSPSPAKKNESRQLTWHKSVMDALESHEFRRRNAYTTKQFSSCRGLNYGKDRKIATTTPQSKCDLAITKGLVAGRTAIFERQTSVEGAETTKQQHKDPAELSLKERFEFFEKNKGTALIPKAAFGMAPSAKQIASSNTSGSESSLISQATPKGREEDIDIFMSLLSCDEPPERDGSAPSAPPMPEVNDGNRTKKVNQKCHSDEHLNVSQGVRDAIEDVKCVQINPPKTGSIYPFLVDSDLDSDAKLEILETSSESDDDSDGDNDMSARTYNESEAGLSDSEYTGIDEYLDEALESDEVDDHQLNARDQRDLNASGSVSSNSFSFERKPSEAPRQQVIAEVVPAENSVESRVPDHSMEGKNSEPLAYTVGSYRHQVLDYGTPVTGRAVCSNIDDSNVSTESEDSDDDEQAHDDHIQSQVELVAAKIKKLQQNHVIQQHQMAQASNALTICEATIGFAGSTESVVAEWKLLIATHSRRATQNEIARLRTERFLRPADAPTESGHLTVKDITLPLKQDYVTNLQSNQISGHHLVCLLKYNEQVVATKTVPTLSGLLSVKFHDTLRLDHVYADFRVTLEIYGMQAQHEVLPHDVKYRIKNKKGVIKTPKGKKAVSRSMEPPMPSPGGPSAMRTPSFLRYGFTTFSLREAQRTNFTLDLVAGDWSPLFGCVYMKINYEFSVNIDHRGFLTMFDVVSGFGAWHRRWCRLHGNGSNNVLLSYWKYPEDERKPPIGNLNLSACEQKVISTAPREVCSRPNTMLLELKRQRHEDDRDSLVLVTKDDSTIVRHLLSTDTKEERNEWIAHFTKALALMRGWGAVQR